MKLSDLFKDKSKYADDMVISINGESIKLADWRSENEASNGEMMKTLKEQEKALETRQTTVKSAEDNVMALWQNYAKITGHDPNDIDGAFKKANQKQVNDALKSGDLDENDPIVGSIVKKINAIESGELKSAKGELAELKKSVGQVLGVYVTREARRAFSEYKMPEGAKVSFEDAFKYAGKNGYKDADGVFDMKKSLDELTAKEREDAWRKEERAKIRKEELDKLASESVPRPGAGVHARKQDKEFVVKDKKGFERTKTFDEVMNDAWSDPDIWKNVTTQ